MLPEQMFDVKARGDFLLYRGTVASIASAPLT